MRPMGLLLIKCFQQKYRPPQDMELTEEDVSDFTEKFQKIWFDNLN